MNTTHVESSFMNNTERTLSFIFVLTLTTITLTLAVNQITGYSFLGKIISALIIFLGTPAIYYYLHSKNKSIVEQSYDPDFFLVFSVTILSLIYALFSTLDSYFKNTSLLSLSLIALSLGAFYFYRKNKLIKNFLYKYHPILLFIFPTLILVSTVFSGPWKIGTYKVVTPSFEALYSSWHILLGLITGSIVTVFLLRNNRALEEKINVSFLAYMLPFLFFDIALSYETQHYNAYLGPANAVLQGGIPLIDVFGQYGLNFLIFSLAFKFLPHTYAAASAVSSFSTCLYLLCAIICLRKLVPHNTRFLVSAFLLVFFFHMSYTFEFNMAPSVAGMRYFPAMLLLTCLIQQQENRTFSIAGVSALIFNIFWSIESTIFALGLYGGYIIVNKLKDNVNLAHYLRTISFDFARLFLIIGLFCLSICGLYFLFTGQLPRYDFYLELVSAYVDQDSELGSRYVGPLEHRFFGWITLTAIYVTILCLIPSLFAKKLKLPHKKLVPYFLITCCGILYGGYFFIHLASPMFMVVLVPAYILMFGFIEILTSTQNTISVPLRVSLLIPLMMIVTLLFAIGFVKFCMPYKYGESNANLLRYFISSRTIFPPDFKEKLHSICPSEAEHLKNPVTNIISACTKDSHHEEAVALLKKWQNDYKKIAIFYLYQTEIQLDLQKRHIVPFSFSWADLFSRKLTKKIMNETSLLGEGDNIIVAKGYKTINSIELRYLNMLRRKWKFQAIDSTQNFHVYKLLARTPDYLPENIILLEAAAQGDLEEMQIALKNGADINSLTEEGRNALQIAVDANFPHLIEPLIAADISINHRDFQDKAAVQLALAKGHDALAIQLSQRIMNDMYLLESGDTIIVSKLKNEFPDLKKLNMLRRKWNLELVDSTQNFYVYKLLARTLDHLPENVILEATTQGDLKERQIALKNGADIHSLTQSGDIIMVSKLKHSFSDLKKLKKGDFELNDTAQNFYPCQLIPNPLYPITAENAILLEAAELGNLKEIQLALTNGANINALTQEGRNALQIAANANFCHLLEPLIAAGISVNHQDLQGNTAIKLALAKGHDHFALQLSNLPKNKALLDAAEKGDLSALEKAIPEADIHAITLYRWNALQLAIYFNKPHLVEPLIAAGIAVDHPGHQGITALELTKTVPHAAEMSAVAKILTEALQKPNSVNDL